MGKDSEAAKGAVIDNQSIADYKKEFENHQLHNRHASVAEIFHRVKEYIKKRIDGIVSEECRKRVMDLTTVALSTMTSMVIPFSGVAVVVAATVIQCLNFAMKLGLIPLLNVRSFNDLLSMSSQIGNTIKRASKSSLMAGVETAVIEILKNLGLGDWLWSEILRDILHEMIGESAMDAAWIMTPLLAAPKYMLHRRLIKKMYRKLGDKAETVHKTWVEQNCVHGAPHVAQTTVVEQVTGDIWVDAYGNVQGACIQSQEVRATHVGASQTSAQPSSYFQPQMAQQWPGHPPPSQPPSLNPAGMVTGYPLQQESSSSFFQPQPAVRALATMAMEQTQQSNSSFFQPQQAAKPQGTIIMGHTPPANSSFFQPQLAAKPQGTVIMGHTPPANSSFFQPQSVGQFQGATLLQPYNAQPEAGGYSQYDAAAQMYNGQSVYPPQGPPHSSPYFDWETTTRCKRDLPSGSQQSFPLASAPAPDLWYQRQTN